MAEGMTELDLMIQERRNSGTAWTRNEKFDRDGYLVIKDLWDPEELYHPVPPEKGQYNYWDKNPEHFNHVPVEAQVEGRAPVVAHQPRVLVHRPRAIVVEEERVPDARMVAVERPRLERRRAIVDERIVLALCRARHGA